MAQRPFTLGHFELNRRGMIYAASRARFIRLTSCRTRVLFSGSCDQCVLPFFVFTCSCERTLAHLALSAEAIFLRAAAMASAILQKDPPPIPAVDADVGLPALEYTIRTCLAKEPEERFQPAHDLKLQLGWLAHCTIKLPDTLPLRHC